MLRCKVCDQLPLQNEHRIPENEKRTREDAQEIVNQFNTRANLPQYVLGIPWYIGHPDHPAFKDEYPDKRAYGRIRKLEVRDDGSAEEAEEHAARIAAAEAALERLDGLAGEDWVLEDTVERLRGLYSYRRRRFATLSGQIEDEGGIQERSLAYQQVMHELLEAQREAILRMRNERLISSDVMRRVERDLDLEESRLET